MRIVSIILSCFANNFRNFKINATHLSGTKPTQHANIFTFIHLKFIIYYNIRIDKTLKNLKFVTSFLNIYTKGRCAHMRGFCVCNM
jgi:hypothetical protein